MTVGNQSAIYYKQCHPCDNPSQTEACTSVTTVMAWKKRSPHCLGHCLPHLYLWHPVSRQLASPSTGARRRHVNSSCPCLRLPATAH
eukprot:314691-Heterocapsa_arctica.AAC.1